MAITEVTLKFSAKKTGGTQVFPGTGEITGTGVDKAAAETAIATTIQNQINSAQGDVDNKQAALDVFNAS